MPQENEDEFQEILYDFVSRGKEDRIETRLLRDRAGRLSLFCTLRADGAEESVRLTDLCRSEERCLAFARAVSESHTHPRVLRELWEEFSS